MADEHDQRRERAVSLLKDAMENGKDSQRIHAAEALLWNNYDSQQIKNHFEAEAAKAGPPFRIGVWRVLARAQGNDRVAAQGYLNRIQEVFLTQGAPDREHALEALAKLRAMPPADALARADQEGPGMRRFARWAAANSGSERDEAALAELLASENMKERASAAYALRYFKSVRPATLRALDSALQTEPGGSVARSYMLSARLAHSSGDDRASIKGTLASAAERGEPQARVELGAALAIVGESADIPLLDRLLGDDDLEVRIGAANAILRIERRQHRGLGWLDWILVSLYGLGMIAIGWWTSRRQKNQRDYFIGSRRISPFMAGISLFATLFSAISFLAHPGEMIKHGPIILVGTLAFPVIYLIVGYGLIPYLMRLPVTSAYEILQGRLGPGVRLLGSGIFVMTRLVWMALMTYVTSRALVQMLGWGPEAVPLMSLIVGIVTIVYTSLGGLEGVVITDVIQFFILYGAGVLTVGYTTYNLGGVGAWFPTSWAPNWDTQPIFSWNPTVRATAVGALLNAVAFWVCTTGSDQLAIQRFLASRDPRAARRAFLINSCASVATVYMLALIGFSLLAFFQRNPHLLADGQNLTGNADTLFPHFIANFLPVGFAGLTLAGMFAATMSSLSSGVNSLCTVFVVDFLSRRDKGKRNQTIVALRWISLAIGGIMIAFSLVMDKVPGNLEEVAVKTGALFMAPLFILFFMALFVPFATPAGAVLGALCSFVSATLFTFWEQIFGGRGISFQLITPTALLFGMVAGPLASVLTKRHGVPVNLPKASEVAE